MKTLSPSKKRGTGLAPTFISIAIFFAAAVAVPAHAVTVANQNASSASLARQSTNQAATGPYTPAVSEIVKLFDAGVDKSVIVAYINNSSVAYRLTASEIIALKDHGVPSEIVTVMLQHNAELKTQQGSNQSQTAAYNQPPAATAPYATPPVYPAYDYSYPQYV